MMTEDGLPVRYPYLISVRGGRPVPARKDGHFYVCAYETFLGLWWSPREVRVLEHDPQRDFYRQERQALLDAHSSTEATTSAPEASVRPGQLAASTLDAADEGPASPWESITPVRPGATPATHHPPSTRTPPRGPAPSR